ncbi:methylmalonyl Co-A mutase-associated GTPase MeaB [Niallia sp. XMNu-256]|uniref:methylmalonyl Co-A mutase-associated GTPase MeaB n=1 Tax=Niallia sp. XMNu-256 TaxID=3082444 RepID=UPI0030D28856
MGEKNDSSHSKVDPLNNRAHHFPYRTFQKKNPQSGITNEILLQGIVKGNRSILSRAITLIESNSEHHFHQAQSLLQQLLPNIGKSLRIGITGVPGAGKSTFIETFGTYLCDKLGLNLAVLAIDPSSMISGGSILGDKTRMEKLSRNPRAFIRPSPSSGNLGGVHRKTRETIVLCEAFGFDVIIVETVGVGQSEATVRDMVDFFMLLVLTGAGDELQGMKKGIMEQTDMIVVNKADGKNIEKATSTKNQYNRILRFLPTATKGWQTKAFTCSALSNQGIEEIWNVIKDFEKVVKASSLFAERRKLQSKEWMKEMILEHLQYRFYHHPEVKQVLPTLEQDVQSGSITVSQAVDELFKKYKQ